MEAFFYLLISLLVYLFSVQVFLQIEWPASWTVRLGYGRHLSSFCLAFHMMDVMCDFFDVADIFPGKVFTNHKVVSEGSGLTFKCSPHGSGKVSSLLYLYLCKDGQGIQRKRQKEDQADIIFTVQSVNLYDSGNYSCVYSPNEYDPNAIFKTGSNTIGILVKGKGFLPHWQNLKTYKWLKMCYSGLLNEKCLRLKRGVPRSCIRGLFLLVMS